MALTYDLTRIKNFETRCYVTLEDDMPMRGLKKGDRVLSEQTDAIIWSMMTARLGEIIEKNVVELYGRLKMCDALLGTDYLKYITLDALRDHVGLQVNVVGETRTKFVKYVTNAWWEAFDRSPELKAEPTTRVIT